MHMEDSIAIILCKANSYMLQSLGQGRILRWGRGGVVALPRFEAEKYKLPLKGV